MADRTVSVAFRANMGQFQQAMANARQEISKVAGELSSLGTAGKKAADDMQPLGVAMLGVGAGIGLAGGLAVKAAIDFESAFAGVRKTVDGTDAQLAAMSDGIRAMSRELPASATEIASVAEAAGALGVSTPAILDFTRVMIDLGETTNLTADEAAVAFARIANVMDTAQSDFDRMGSVVVALGNNGASTEAEIVELANRLAAAGEIAGLTEANVFAFAETLASVGVEAEAGGTALSKVFTSIRDAVLDGSEKLDTFADVAGVSTARFAAMFRQDAAGAIASFVEGLGRISDSGESTTQVFEDLELTDQRLMRALLSTGAAGDYLRQQIGLANQAWEENSALTDEAAKRYETTAAQLEKLRNNITDLAIEFGSALLPVIQATASLLDELLEGFRAMPEPVRLLMAGSALLLGVLTALGGAFLVLLPRIIAVQGAYTALAATAPTVAAGLRTITIAAGGIGVALAAATTLYAIFSKSQDVAAESTQNMAAAFEAFGRGEQAAARRMVLESLAKEGLLDVFNELGLTAAAVGEIMTTSQDGTGKNVAAIQAWDKALRAAVDAGELTELEAAEISKRMFEMSNAYANAAGTAADVADGQRVLGGATDDTADTVDGATIAVADYAKALDGLLAATYGVADASDRFQSDLASLADDVASAKEAGDSFATSLDATNTSGLKNRETLRQLAESAAAVASELVAAGEDPAVAMQQLHTNLLATLEGLGFNRAEAENLLAVILQFPAGVNIAINVDTARAEERLTRLLRLIQLNAHGIDVLEAERWAARSGRANSGGSSAVGGLGTLPTITSSFGGSGGSGETAQERADRMEAEADRRMRARFGYGAVGVEDYKRYLNERLAATEMFSGEWETLWGEVQRVNQEIGQGWLDAAEQMKALEDAGWEVLARMNEVGDLSTREFLNQLEDRLAGLQQYSDEWMETWRTVHQLRDDITQDQLDIMAAVEKERLYWVGFNETMEQRFTSGLREVAAAPQVVVRGGTTASFSQTNTITAPSVDGAFVTANERMRDAAFHMGL